MMMYDDALRCDVLNGPDADDLPNGSIVRSMISGTHLAREKVDGSWLIPGSPPAIPGCPFHLGEDRYELLHRGVEPRREVGELIADEAQAAALPPGTVAVDEDDVVAERRAAVKVHEQCWRYYNPRINESRHFPNSFADGLRVVYIPDADTSSGGAET